MNKKMFRPITLLFSMVLLFGSLANGKDKQDPMSQLKVDGLERTYIVHVPPNYSADHPIPLIFVLHGGGGHAAQASLMSDMNSRADEKGFLVCYPNGTGLLKKRFLTWNTWNCCGYAAEKKVDDVAFFRKLIDTLKQKYAVDPKRIYVTGISNGGMMSYRLGCELADKIAAIAPVSGALNTDECRPSEPVSVVAFHGTADEHVPYKGGKGAKRLPSDRDRVDRSVAYSVSSWVGFDGCSTTPERHKNGSIETEQYAGGKNGTEVVLYTIDGGQHAWPGMKVHPKNRKLDVPTQEISASDIIVDFFFKHPKQ